MLELERVLDAGATEPPDAPGEFADAITAIRLATSAPIAAGPVLFERLDWRPYGIRPVVPIAATQPAGEPERLDSFRAASHRPPARLEEVDDDPELGEAIDRWELSRFQDGPFQAEQLRESLAALLGGQRRLVGRGGSRRRPARRDAAWTGGAAGTALRGSGPGCCSPGDRRDDPARRSRGALKSLDESILGLRPAPYSPKFPLRNSARR